MRHRKYRECPDCPEMMFLADPAKTPGPKVWECENCGRALRIETEKCLNCGYVGKPTSADYYGTEIQVCENCGVEL
jgi:ribosomal protein S27AE